MMDLRTLEIAADSEERSWHRLPKFSPAGGASQVRKMMRRNE
jgi:hypothetical protein